jgi:hypothetical protein
MTQQKFADFEPQTMLSDSDFDVFESKGRVRLSPEHRAAVERELKEYEFLRFLEERGVGTAHKKALLKLEAMTEKFVGSIEAVRNKPGHIWEYLLAESGAEVSGLPSLLTKCKELNKRVARSGRKRDMFLDRLLSRLADIFLQAGGRSTNISHGAKAGRGGHFLEFAFAVLEHLPRQYRPQSKNALGVRWERILKNQKSGKMRAYTWVGRPHPSSAKPWFEKTQF